MSEAGLSLDTATSRTGLFGVGEEAAAVLTRAVTAERLARRVEVRAGVAAMLGVWSSVDGVVMAVLGLVVGWLRVMNVIFGSMRREGKPKSYRIAPGTPYRAIEEKRGS